MTAHPRSSRRRLALGSLRLASLALATLAAATANIWIAKHRMEGYAFKYTGYVSIYHPAEIPTITGFGAVTSDRVEVAFSAPGKRWRTSSDDALGPTQGGRGIAVEIGPGLESYELEVWEESDPPGRSRRIDIGAPPEPLFSTADFAVGEFEQHSWRDQTYHVEQYPEEHVARVRELLEPAGILSTDTTLTRLEKLWKLLRPRLAARSGTPPPWLRTRSAFGQYEAMMSGEACGYCSHFAVIYSLFGTVAGIPLRNVDSGGDVDGVSLSAHAFNEVYIPELQQWVYSDMNLGIAYVRDAVSGRYMNTVQLIRSHEAGAVGGLVATVLRDGELVEVPYFEVGALVRVFLNPNASFLFQRFYRDRSAPTAWLDRYLFRPEQAYRMYGDNRRHYLKLAAFYGSVILGLVWGGLAVRWVVRRARRAAPHASPS